MTFNYEAPQRLSIWMYNTWIDLSVAFLDDNKVIREIYELKAYPDQHDPNFFRVREASSSFMASYALEMNAGWFKAHGVKLGDRVV